jgi:hypothetical protein
MQLAESQRAVIAAQRALFKRAVAIASIHAVPLLVGLGCVILHTDVTLPVALSCLPAIIAGRLLATPLTEAGKTLQQAISRRAAISMLGKHSMHGGYILAPYMPLMVTPPIADIVAIQPMAGPTAQAFRMDIIVDRNGARLNEPTGAQAT